MASLRLTAVVTHVSASRLVAKLIRTFAPLENVMLLFIVTTEQYLSTENMVMPGPNKKNGMSRLL